ncbi:hypothetical protein LI90_2212 [Carbonactinospora thermoautotrophica]|uniref:Uncharacterized protein n=1 Tax=Carbonactinospora thermoautotrophica TaxID=1469144 RepID=A0A132MTQ7_9ACTN|nr:hypothetical protein LI90_2212 [Carbonactinospora thermoautotrophica]
MACGKLVHDHAYPCRFLDCRYTTPEHRIQATDRVSRAGT